jgi:hypothetical protein
VTLPNPMRDSIDDFELTKFGFRWGPLHVDRCCSDKIGGVVLRVSVEPFPKSCERNVEIRVSPKGRVMQVGTHGKVGKL